VSKGRSSILEGRWAIVALALAFLGSTFAAGAHWLAVPHRVCEIHGTIEHGRASEAATPAELPATGPIVGAAEQPHERCELGPVARTEAVLPPAPVSCVHVLAESRGRVFLPADPAPSVPLLLLAPSRSPPV
jgi:hypothetical protein